MNRDVTFISVFNAGGLSLAQNLLTSLARQNLLQHHVSFVTDDESIAVLRVSHPSARVKRWNSSDDTLSSAPESFATKGFNRLSFLRYEVIADLLRANVSSSGAGYIWYLDVDTVVLGDLLQYFHQTLRPRQMDLVLQDDLNMGCTGCMLFRPSAGSLALAECMVKNRRDDENDQMVLDRLLRSCRGDIRLRVALLDTGLFPNGLLFFGPESHAMFARQIAKYKNSGSAPLFVHANWMVGLETKKRALESRQLWFTADDVVA